MTEREKKPLKSAAEAARRATHPVSIVERRMSKFLREPPSVRLAANVIVTATLIVVVLGGVMMRALDHEDYSSVWLGMWWVLQTVTTVGYGDLTPHNAIGKILTSLVMLWGIAFLAIITAAITSVFVARAQRERAMTEESELAPVMAQLLRVDEQLTKLATHTEQMDERLDRLTERLEKNQP